MLTVLFWSVVGYLCGSIPFAVLIGKFIVKVDPRTVGDGNPGGSNVWIAGGWKIGLATAIIEILKAFVPVWLAMRAGLSGWLLVPIGLAPILGHATQPFLGWHGGKALGTTGGTWFALVGWQAFFVYALGALPALALQREHTYAALAGMMVLLGFTVFFDGTNWLIAFALLNSLLLFWTHRRELGRPWQWRNWVFHFFLRRSA